MKKMIVCFTLLGLLPAGALAGVILSTSNPVVMTAGTTTSGGAMNVTVIGDNLPPNVMAFWQVTLDVVPILGSGTVMFVNPTTPSNYVFSPGVGLSVSATPSTHLSASDFDSNLGTTVPATGKNLLQLDFLASAGASGTFGIYAEDGLSNFNTYWTTSPPPTDVSFSNIPDDSGRTLIGQVTVVPALVPEPSTLTLLGLGTAILAGWRKLWRAKSPQIR